MNILALCGSLRENSSNHSLLTAFHHLLPHSAIWNYFPCRDLPFFDPERQFGPEIPSSVRQLRACAVQADYILISTPEYAHGIPGLLKNALEWLVCEESMQKKVILFIGSPSGGEFVREYLSETLRTMDLDVSEDRTLSFRSLRQQVSTFGDILDPSLKDILLSLLQKISA